MSARATSNTSESLASVVHLSGQLDPLLKLDDDKPFAQLHKRYWGTALNSEEEAGSVKRHLDLTDEGSKGDTDESGDADIIPGCSILHFDHPNIPLNRIWIRAEYIRIYDHLKDFYREMTNSVGAAPAAVITGQPGIGKSLWLYYALWRCLSEKRSVIWRYEGVLYLFVQEGVFQLPTHNFHQYFSGNAVWTLVDSDESPLGVPEELVSHDTKFYVIYTTSPACERWSHLHKTARPIILVMNPWTRGEIHRAAPLQLPSPDRKVIDDTYDKFGPIPRLCFSDPDVIRSHLHSVSIALSDLRLERFERLITGAANLSMVDLSSKLCLIRRTHKEDLDSGYDVTPITDYMQTKLAITLRNRDARQQIELYRTCAAIPPPEGWPADRISIECVPMVHLDALGDTVTLNVRPSDTYEYCDDDLRTLDPLPDVYYIPRITNEVALDSFIWHNGFLYLFQFQVTVDQRHGIKDAILERLSQLDPSRFSLRYIFVIPDDIDGLECPYPRSPELRKLRPYSSKVSVDDGSIRMGAPRAGDAADRDEGLEAPPAKRSKRKAKEGEGPAAKKFKATEEFSQGSSTGTTRKELHSSRKGL